MRGAAAGDVDEITAARLELQSERDAVLDCLAILHPVHARNPHAQHQVRHCSFDSLKNLKWKAHAVLQRATVLIGALVGDGREKLMNQVAMRAVKLNADKSNPLGANGSIDKRLFDSGKAGLV